MTTAAAERSETPDPVPASSPLRAVRLNALTYPVEEGEREELRRAGAELAEIEGQEPEEILAAAHDADALLVVSSRVPGAVIAGLSRCRVIARLGAGTDRIDVAEASRQGIVVANVPDFCINELAEHTLALLLACGGGCSIRPGRCAAAIGRPATTPACTGCTGRPWACWGSARARRRWLRGPAPLAWV